ncbi:MAG: NYN domain-containing protein [Verrucomicrobiae bacterium]|nr:NYN domain-containing protein [Verrucomicrobiae bacterium]
MEQTPTESIALLIDADNAPAAKIDFILSELASHGKVNIRRAYGNWKKRALSGWEKVLHEYAIQPIQHFDLIKGKNATDMGLVIEAMDILYTKEVDTFCLVTSDCDFTPLVLRLRVDGKQVIGFGGQKTPEPFINGCTKFLYLDEVEKNKSAKEVRKTSANQLKGNTKLMHTLRNAVQATEDEDGWAPLGPVGAHISNQGPFDHRTYGFAKLSDLFAAIDRFEVEKTHTGNRLFVRVRYKGPAKSGKRGA